MSNKSQRKEQAQLHIARLHADYAMDIERGISSSRIYEAGQVEKLAIPESRHGKCEIVVAGTDTVSAIMKESGSICALNFASYRSPGGGFSNGALAQEEALCSESTLFPVLEHFRSSFYEANQKALNRCLYTSRSIYSGHIVFMRDGREKVTSVITCAAPNRKAAIGNGASAAECDAALKERISAVMGMAAANEADTLILGAFGCGVFRNDPSFAAGEFKAWLDAHPGVFAKVVFAIPPDGPNLAAFKEVFLDF